MMKRFTKGEPVLIIGNTIRRGTIDGRYRKGLYVIKLDRSIKTGRREKECFSLVVVHSDNIGRRGVK